MRSGGASSRCVCLDPLMSPPNLTELPKCAQTGLEDAHALFRLRMLTTKYHERAWVVELPTQHELFVARREKREKPLWHREPQTVPPTIVTHSAQCSAAIIPLFLPRPGSK